MGKGLEQHRDRGGGRRQASHARHQLPVRTCPPVADVAALRVVAEAGSARAPPLRKKIRRWVDDGAATPLPLVVVKCCCWGTDQGAAITGWGSGWRRTAGLGMGSRPPWRSTAAIIHGEAGKTTD